MRAGCSRVLRAPVLAVLGLAALLAGCYSWPPADTAMQVFNETDHAVIVQMSVFDRNGLLVHEDEVAVAPRSMAEVTRLHLPAGSYSVLARSDSGLEAQELYSIGRETPSLKVWLSADGLRLGLSST